MTQYKLLDLRALLKVSDFEKSMCLFFPNVRKISKFE